MTVVVRVYLEDFKSLFPHVSKLTDCQSPTAAATPRPYRYPPECPVIPFQWSLVRPFAVRLVLPPWLASQLRLRRIEAETFDIVKNGGSLSSEPLKTTCNYQNGIGA